MKHLKLSIILLVAVMIVILATATIVESAKGTLFAHQNIYSAAWFVILWAVIAIAAAVYIMRRKLYRKPAVLMLHVSLLVILLGALLSWLTAESGSLHLRNGEKTTLMKNSEGESEDLGFAVALRNFSIVCYPGTDAPMDYVSELRAGDEDVRVSMNSIGSHNDYRFTQAGYDSDMQGTTLTVLHDPWGIGVTYAGYLLLLLSLIATLASKCTRIRELYHRATVSAGTKVLALAFLLMAPFSIGTTKAQEKIDIDKSMAADFGRMCALYDNRITPVSTIARQFVVKLSGKSSWDGLSATEVFAGWVFDVPYWENVRMIEVKDKKAQELLGLKDKWASFSDFWDQYNAYKLEKPLKEAAQHGDTKLQKQLREADEKFNIIRMLYGGEMLKIFPIRQADGSIKWFAPGQPLGKVKLSGEEQMFIRKSMDYLAESIITGDKARAESLAKKIYSYQHIRAKDVIPSKFKIYSEIFYNGFNGCHMLVMVYLLCALIINILYMRASGREGNRIRLGAYVLTGVMLFHTTLLLILRWYVSGHLPMSNGFETMQFMAWATLILSLVLARRLPPARFFGVLLSALALLVAMITDKNPQITQLMPVLQSPLLSVHVMVIMFSYSLLGLMALVSVEGIVAWRRGDVAKTEGLAAMSQFLLYPAVALLAVGIFIGAVWANVSWGRYWSWDSKETWALITLLLYSAPLHSDIKWMHKPLHIHIYMLLAFLSVLMTYFGVNYFLAGMHSYA